MDDQPFRYGVFLSYAHADRRWARRLANLLETWKVPRRLVGEEGAFGPVPATLGPVFRDRDELSASAELGATINKALRDSAAMVVICSPAAARSKWVNEEIRTFKALGRGNRIFSFIVDGDPNAGDGRDQCFPPVLRFQVDARGHITDAPAEPIAADARQDGDGTRRARLKLLAGLLGVRYDDLAHREQHRRNQRLAAITSAAVVGMVITLGLAITAWISRQDAERRQEQAEGLINFMLEDLYDRLEALGQTTILERVGNKGLEYFNSTDPKDLNDEMLARRAEALYKIGAVKIGLGESDAAMNLCQESLEVFSDLAERHPDEPTHRFGLGQAQFFIGLVHYKRDEYDAARLWFVRYRETSEGLARAHPDNTDYQLEAAYSYMNLAAIEIGQGSVDEAAALYESARETIESMLETDPENRALVETRAEALSWLGTVRERQGNLEASEQTFERAAAGFQQIHQEYPDDRNAEERWVTELGQLCRMLRIRGRRDQTIEFCRQVRDAASALVAHDPRNRDWRRTFGHALLGYGDALLQSGVQGEARQQIETGLVQFESLVGDDSTVADWRIMLAAGHRLIAELELAVGNLREAYAAASRALETLDDSDLGSGRRILLERAHIRLVSGKAAAQTGRSAAAASDWAAGLEALAAAQGDYPDAIEMSLRAELLSLTGRCEDAELIVTRIAEMGAATPDTGCGGIEEEIAGT